MNWWNKSLSYWLRAVHRDLGFLMVGLCLVYGISGFLLNHMDGKDPAFKTTEATVVLTKGMDQEALEAEWNAGPERPLLKKILGIDEGTEKVLS